MLCFSFFFGNNIISLNLEKYNHLRKNLFITINILFKISQVIKVTDILNFIKFNPNNNHLQKKKEKK